ncbi:uncharacterized protein [Phaenicophaeus curvirostris]|uniref:uncharacterized protein n=1 Tax=Phaenicophaeus curvirostris TaxID=33595 RepID=UPI0037F0F695
MSPLPDPEAPRETRDRTETGTGTEPRTGTRTGTRSRRLLLRLLGAVAVAVAAAVGAFGAFAGLSRAARPTQVSTAAHVLLSAGSLTVPPGPSWRYEKGISGVFLSADVQMRTKKLEVTTGGLYLLYGQFSLSCTVAPCPPGTVTLQLRREGSPRPVLAVPLTLPDEAGPDPVSSGLAQAVGQLQAGDVLSLALDGDVDGEEWQLAQDRREDNFIGLLRIAGGV